MKIRKAELRDAATIVDFNRKMAMETENKELDETRVIHGVKSMLKDPHKGFFLVAESHGEIVGQLMVTNEWSDWRDKYFLWIQSVYVAEESRRKGVFSALFNHLKALASYRKDVAGLRLYVKENNATAKETYRMLGMCKSGYDMYEVTV
ncbi:MAG: GNAT family N-acetyltransferase [bacterium]|nr:GNAT family N-acetyltransferase [bacterium]